MRFSLALCLLLSFSLAEPVLADESINTLNAAFRSAYTDAKKRIIANMGPVIVAAGDNVILVDGARREVVNTISPEYTLLKTVDHIPLALFVILNNRTGSQLSEDQKQALRSVSSLVQQAMPNIATANLPASTKDRLSSMLTASKAFAEKAEAHGVTQPELDSFISSQRNGTLQNIEDATALELSALDAAVKKWKAQYTLEQWSQLSAVVASGHMPRQQERRMQYFGLLLGEKHEGGRLVYVEGPSDLNAALDSLATHRLDEAISREYFKDKWRMHRDLLSDAAARYLKKHPPKK